MQNIALLAEQIAALEAVVDKMKWNSQCLTCKRSGRGDYIGRLKPSEAIVHCLRELDRPVGVKFLRKKIEEMGYPMRRFGTYSRYYYTLICRLAKDGKIKRLEGDEVVLTG